MNVKKFYQVLVIGSGLTLVACGSSDTTGTSGGTTAGATTGKASGTSGGGATGSAAATGTGTGAAAAASSTGGTGCPGGWGAY